MSNTSVIDSTKLSRRIAARGRSTLSIVAGDARAEDDAGTRHRRSGPARAARSARRRSNSDVVTICRSCGWYASLGTFVEVDPNWETATDETGTGAAGSADVAPACLAQPHAALGLGDHRQRVCRRRRKRRRAIGDAGRQLAAHDLVARPVGDRRDRRGRAAMCSTSVAGGGGCRLRRVGFVAEAAQAVGAHVSRLADAAVGCRTRPLCGLVGSDHVARWSSAAFRTSGFGIGVSSSPPKQDLMGAVMDRAKELDSRNGADNLEDAIGDFAGKGDVDWRRTDQSRAGEAARESRLRDPWLPARPRRPAVDRCCSARPIAASWCMPGACRRRCRRRRTKRSAFSSLRRFETQQPFISIEPRTRVGAAEVHVPRQLHRAAKRRHAARHQVGQAAGDNEMRVESKRSGEWVEYSALP